MTFVGTRAVAHAMQQELIRLPLRQRQRRVRDAGGFGSRPSRAVGDTKLDSAKPGRVRRRMALLVGGQAGGAATAAASASTLAKGMPVVSARTPKDMAATRLTQPLKRVVIAVPLEGG